jgi:hypothetical protein
VWGFIGAQRLKENGVLQMLQMLYDYRLQNATRSTVDANKLFMQKLCCAGTQFMLLAIMILAAGDAQRSAIVVANGVATAPHASAPARTPRRQHRHGSAPTLALSHTHPHPHPHPHIHPHPQFQNPDT